MVSCRWSNPHVPDHGTIRMSQWYRCPPGQTQHGRTRSLVAALQRLRCGEFKLEQKMGPEPPKKPGAVGQAIRKRFADVSPLQPFEVCSSLFPIVYHCLSRKRRLPLTTPGRIPLCWCPERIPSWWQVRTISWRISSNGLGQMSPESV